MQPAASRGIRKGIRVLLQTIAGGGLTALVALVAGGLSPTTAATLTALFGSLVAFLHNYLETNGTIPVLLPTPGLVTTTAGGLVGKTVGTVDAVAADSGKVVGDVLNTTGAVVGGVTSAATSLLGGIQ